MNIKGDFTGGLVSYVTSIQKPEDEITHTAKHRRISPISVLAGREHEHETLNFLAVFLPKLILIFQWVRGFLCFSESIEIVLLSLSLSLSLCLL
jgi:hypothetical protein